MSAYHDHFPAVRVIIGVIHLPPLLGYPDSPGLEACIDKALSDLAALKAGGAHGALVKNEYDRPHALLAARETMACMTRITREVVAAAENCVVGVEILINDPEASLAVAQSAEPAGLPCSWPTWLARSSRACLAKWLTMPGLAPWVTMAVGPFGFQPSRACFRVCWCE